MNIATVPRLKTLEVPWMVSPSVPDLSLRIDTSNGCMTACVTFLGFFGENTPTSRQFGKYRSVEVQFRNVLFAKLFPEYSREDRERIDGYD